MSIDQSITDRREHDRTSRIAIVMIGAFLIALITLLALDSDKPLAARIRSQARGSLERTAAIRNSPWNHSVPQVEQYLKTHMNDWKSFEAVQWGDVTPEGSGYSVRLRYRGKNGVGALMIYQQVFHLNAAGEVYKVDEESEG